MFRSTVLGCNIAEPGQNITATHLNLKTSESRVIFDGI